MQQAHEARLHILDEMAKVMPEPRKELSKYAPQVKEFMVNPDIIRLIIGPGGKNIKAITTSTGASVDIEDNGHVSIFAPSKEALDKAYGMISYYDQRPEVGKNYVGKVRKIMEIGAIVEILPNVEALVHVSQLDIGRVSTVESAVKLGQELEVKVIEIVGDRIRCSHKAVLLERQGRKWEAEDNNLKRSQETDRGEHKAAKPKAAKAPKGKSQKERGNRDH